VYQHLWSNLVGSGSGIRIGNASLDLDDDETAGVGTYSIRILLLVYAGGASEWQDRGLSSDECTSCCCTDTGFVPVGYLSGGKHGGSPDFEQLFKLRFLYFFPADSYSLILWDHGGGPVLGYGVDENFRDLLTLDELSEALEDSVGAHMTKLEWIGFDACLMSSLEVASVLGSLRQLYDCIPGDRTRLGLELRFFVRAVR